MLRDYGRLSVRDVLEPAIYYAEHGHPVLPRVADTIAGLAAFFEKEWPTSHETWLPGGKPPAPHSNFRNPALAQTWKRVIAEAEGKRGREAQIEAARDGLLPWLRRRGDPGLSRQGRGDGRQRRPAQGRADRQRHGDLVGERRSAC